MKKYKYNGKIVTANSKEEAITKVIAKPAPRWSLTTKEYNTLKELGFKSYNVKEYEDEGYVSIGGYFRLNEMVAIHYNNLEIYYKKNDDYVYDEEISFEDKKKLVKFLSKPKIIEVLKNEDFLRKLNENSIKPFITKLKKGIVDLKLVPSENNIDKYIKDKLKEIGNKRVNIYKDDDTFYISINAGFDNNPNFSYNIQFEGEAEDFEELKGYLDNSEILNDIKKTADLLDQVQKAAPWGFEYIID